jgi:sn-glycerol 3-phosphate transport system permease protein
MTTLSPASPQASRRNRDAIWRHALPYLLILPTLVFVLMFTLLPATRTVIDSTYQPGRRASLPSEFVGIENYQDIFDDTHHIGSRFTRVLTNTLLFAAGTVIFALPLALGMALLLNRQLRYMGFWRFAFFYPSLLPLLGAASIWAFLYSDSIGLINRVLDTFGIDTVNWLGDPNRVLVSIIFFNVWKQAGYYMIFYLAGLQSIPKDIYEAARLDGANAWRQLLSITLPLLRRTTLFVLVVAFTFAFQTVEQLQAMNQGNPADRGNLLLYFIFQNIGERRNWGYINAMTVVLVAILLIFTAGNFFLFERGGREDDR